MVLYLWKGTVVSQSPDGKELIDNEKDVLAENGSVTLIGKAEFKIEGELSDWTRISVPVDYLSEEAPEKMNITISGADYCNRSLIKENNTLSVQSVELIYKDPVSTEKVQLPSDLISVVDNILYLNGNYKNLTVYAMSGKQVYYSARPGETVSPVLTSCWNLFLESRRRTRCADDEVPGSLKDIIIRRMKEILTRMAYICPISNKHFNLSI